MFFAYKVYQLSRVIPYSGHRGRMPCAHLRPTLWGSLVLLAVAPPAVRAQQDSTPAASARLEELQQRIRILERLRELEADSNRAAALARPTMNIGADGFTFRSPDGRWRLRVGGYFQVDGRYYLRDTQSLGTSSFIVRRARRRRGGDRRAGD